MPDTKTDIIEFAKARGFSFKMKSNTDKVVSGTDLYPIKDFKEMVVLAGAVSASLINKDFSIMKLIQKGYAAYEGWEHAGRQALDMTPEEFQEVYDAFCESFDIVNDLLESFVQRTFFRCVDQTMDTLDYITRSKNMATA